MVQRTVLLVRFHSFESPFHTVRVLGIDEDSPYLTLIAHVLQYLIDEQLALTVWVTAIDHHIRFLKHGTDILELFLGGWSWMLLPH